MDHPAAAALQIPCTPTTCTAAARYPVPPGASSPRPRELGNGHAEDRQYLPDHLAPARPRRKSSAGPSISCWEGGWACTAVMIAWRTPIRRLITSATGAMRLVVQLAHEIICCPVGAWFTPCTTVATVSARAGAGKLTNRAPAARCFLRSSSRRNAPVYASTRSTPSFAGAARQARTRTGRPSVHDQRVAADGHWHAVAPADSVIPEQVRYVARRDQVVDGGRVGSVNAERDLQGRPGDPAEAVDGDARHGPLLPRRACGDPHMPGRLAQENQPPRRAPARGKRPQGTCKQGA